MSLKKSVLFFMVLWLCLQPCFSEKSYTIKESELNQIQEQTVRLQNIVNEQKNSISELTNSVKTLETQRNQYLMLSNELRTENKKLKKKNDRLTYISLGACSALLGVTALTFFK